MPTTKAITSVVPEAIRTDDTGGKWLVSLVTYTDASQARIVQPLGEVKPL